MSGILAGAIWLSDLQPHLKPVAATLADLANDQGGSIHPGVAYVAWRLSVSESTVRRNVAALRDAGILVAVCHPQCIEDPGAAHGRGQPVEYHLIAERLPQRRPWAEERADREKALTVTAFSDDVEPPGKALTVTAFTDERQSPPLERQSSSEERQSPTSPDPSGSIRDQIDPKEIPSLTRARDFKVVEKQSWLEPALSEPELTDDQRGMLRKLHAAIQRDVYGGTDAPRAGWGAEYARRGMTAGDIAAAVEAMKPTAGARPKSLLYGERVLERRIEEREGGHDPDERTGGHGDGRTSAVRGTGAYPGASRRGNVRGRDPQGSPPLGGITIRTIDDDEPADEPPPER